MIDIPLTHLLILGAILFCLGMLAVITKRHAIVVLMGIELVFNAANINLIAFNRYQPNLMAGQIFALFVMVIAAAETAVALALVLKVYQYFKTVNLDQIRQPSRD